MVLIDSSTEIRRMTLNLVIFYVDDMIVEAKATDIVNKLKFKLATILK